jgi:predicted ATPase
VTFLFTDIEGSTRLWQQDEDLMRAAVAHHDSLLRSVIADHNGSVFSASGDGMAAAFPSAAQAVRAALAAQARLAEQSWPTSQPLRVRMGLHTGEAESRDGDYFGTTVNRAARVMATGHGGQVLCSAATASLVDDGAAFIDLGEHHLRDLDRPMRLFQVGEGNFPPLRSLDTLPGNLPSQLTSFVGREHDLLLVAKTLQTSRLVTVTGTGGVGKTRLTIQAAADAITGFPDGRWLCELAVASDPDAMLQVVALALGLTPGQGLTLARAIAEFVSTRRLLLILDNCEHLLDPAADFVGQLLARCPNVRVLATSREALGIPGEQVIRLRSLAVPAAGTLLDQLNNVEATRLFLERAQATGAPVAYGPTDAEAIIEICRRLDGIPLAIELAAARVVALSPTEIAAHLDERFRLLTGGRRAALERHHTLRAAVDWSYSLLDGSERAVFERLGVFPGTFDVAGAQSVAEAEHVQAWDVLDALASLVAKSMLLTDRAADGSTRYQMLETLRHYARERLDAAGFADACRRAHARHYAAVAVRLLDGVRGGDQVAARQVIVELDNFRAAVAWALDSADEADGELAMCIVAALFACGQAGSTGIHAWAQQALDHAASNDARYRGLVLAAAAVGAYFRGEFELGRRLAEDAVRGGVADSLSPQGVFSPGFIFARPDELPGLVKRDVAMLKDAHADVRDYIRLHSSAANMAAELGQMAIAREQAAIAVELCRRDDRNLERTLAMYSYALAWWQARPEAALAALQETVAVDRQIVGSNAAVQARARALAAQLHADAGEIQPALQTFREAVLRAHGDGDRPSEANAVARGANVMHAAGDDEAAAVFAGAVARGALARLHALPTHERPGYRELLHHVRAKLGEDVYETANGRGATMAYEELIRFALDRVDIALSR